MSWKICRFSAPRPEPRSAQEPPGHSPFRRLFRFSASVDHQMTPALFAGAFRAVALSPRSLADRLSGTPSAALRPKASRGAGLRGGDGGLRAELRLAPLELRAEGRLPSCSAGLRFPSLQGTLSAALLSPFSPRAQRLRVTFSNFERRSSVILPGLSRLLLCPVLRWLEALLPETERFASRPLEQAALEGRERDDACRAACGTRQFFPKTDRARARSELGESQRGAPGDGRGFLIRRRRER